MGEGRRFIDSKSYTFNLIRIAILLLFMAAGCNAQPRLTIILVADSLITYNGELSASSKVSKLPADKSAVKALLEENKRTYADKLFLTLKLADDGGGNAMSAAEAFLMTDRLAASMNIKKQTALPDNNEQKRFAVTVFQRPGEQSLKLYLPRDADTKESSPVNPKYLLTLVPDQDKCFYYKGDLSSMEQVKKVDYEKLREVIISFRKEMGDSILIFIKPAEKAGYKNIVNVLDEMTINDIKKYAMLDLTKEEEERLGLQGFMSFKETEYIPPGTELLRKPDLVFILSKNGDITYTPAGQTEKIRISPPSANNIVKVIDKTARALNKNASNLAVDLVGDKDAKYPQFKQLMDALKQRDLINFKMISN